MSQALPSGQPIEQIVLVPSVEQVLVLSGAFHVLRIIHTSQLPVLGHQIYFFSYPNLEPIEEIKPVRNIVSFALDEAQLRKPPSDRRTAQQEFIRMCVMKRSAINIYLLMSRRLQFRKVSKTKVYCGIRKPHKDHRLQ